MRAVRQLFFYVINMGFIFNSLYHKLLIHRYDDNHYVYYFSKEDFLGLKGEPFSFLSKQGNRLKGYFYSYPGYKKDHLLIFCHGIGGGHRSYMREIETLCQAGFQVVAYDNTGYFESEGKDIRGITQALSDLHSCLLYLEKEGYLKDKKVDLIGHSMGGYAVGNILNYYSKIDSICVISGFVSLPLIGKALAKGFYRSLYRYEKKINPEYVDSTSIQAYKKAKAKILLIHSKDDPIVAFSTGLGLVKKEVDNPNLAYLEVDHKAHNPNYMEDAVAYMNQSFADFNSLLKKGKLKSLKEKQDYMNKLDWRRMTEQDPDIFAKIIENILK